MKKTPNLFDLATSELSQDAFITWLLQWASPQYAEVDAALHGCATVFTKRLLALQGVDVDHIESIEAGRQWNNIDVWAKVNNAHLLVLEDKTFTGQHSNQLQRYKEQASEWCAANTHDLVCVYVKTGSESMSRLNKVRQQGFAVLQRKEMLDVLLGCETRNEVFVDFVRHLSAMEESESGFADKPIGQWKDSDWIGFYRKLEMMRTIVNWEYVNNPMGGFWNAVLNWNDLPDCCPYMQIEQGLLCFKIGEVDKNRSEIRNRYHDEWMRRCANLPEIRRPGRLGSGAYMTIAVVDRQVWLGADNERIDIERVVENLHRYEEAYASFINGISINS
jgi:hypothetical protein